MDRFDVVIVGAGTGGQTAAHDLRDKGLKVAVIESSDRPGGICALAGCQAKKWFYEVAETVAKSRHLLDKGILSPPTGAWAAVLGEKNDFTSRVPGRTVEGFKTAGIDFLPGSARFLDPDTLAVDGKKIAAEFFVLATGARPRPLAMAGADLLVTSDGFLDMENPAGRILFVGGGFISFEFAHFAARLGPEGTRCLILEVGDRPLKPFDSEMVDLLVRASAEEGIEVRTGVQIESVERGPSGFTATAGTGETFDADLVVHGAGRSPNIETLDLDSGGIAHTRKGIVVDRGMETSNPNVFAVGDCAATVQLARVADHEAHVAANNILSKLGRARSREIDYGSVPAVLFTYPQFAMVGKTEDALKREGVAYTRSFSGNLEWPTYTRIGMKHAAFKILTGTDGKILGAHMLSDYGSGVINTVRMAMIQKTSATDLYWQSVMTPYPTRESDLLYMLKPFLT
jgi:glutathione reductase (NADPH)